MTSYVFQPYDTDEWDSISAEEEQRRQQRQAIRDRVLSIQEATRQAEEEYRRHVASQSRNRIVTFRVPHELLDRLDAVTADAATSRGHMLRQIVTEYMAYVDECGIRYNGSLLSAHSSLLAR